MGGLGGIVYCACDDSNHKGEEGHEIVLATFSFFPGDGKFQTFKNRRNCRPDTRKGIYADARRWMKDTVRDYRFVAISREEFNMELNVPWVFPLLIKGYLEDCPYDVENIRAYVDGPFGKDGKKNILEQFPDFKDMRVGSIVKKSVGRKKNKPRMLKCPKVLWGADIWANIIYNEGVESNLVHPKRIVIR